MCEILRFQDWLFRHLPPPLSLLLFRKWLCSCMKRSKENHFSPPPPSPSGPSRHLPWYGKRSLSCTERNKKKNGEIHTHLHSRTEVEKKKPFSSPVCETIYFFFQKELRRSSSPLRENLLSTFIFFSRVLEKGENSTPKEGSKRWQTRPETATSTFPRKWLWFKDVNWRSFWEGF